MNKLLFVAGLASLVTLLSASPEAGELEVEWNAPEVFVEGLPYRVHVDILAPADGASLRGWMLTAAAFQVNGKPVYERVPGTGIELVPNSRISLEFDLAPQLRVEGSFKLGFGSSQEMDVTAYRRAPESTNFMEVPDAELGRYRVVLDTNRGMMLAEFWPDVAPNHVRNFLDLSHTGFYDGILFHRVIPGFMIQGGDPYTKNPDKEPRSWGTGSGPRTLEAEFNDRAHVRGVLSMARLADPHSATSQFFVVHDVAPHLDNEYTAFGKLISGFDALDKIANCKKVPRTDRPAEKQRIDRAAVVVPFQE